MKQIAPKCIERVGNIICSDCNELDIFKYGKSKCGKQRYRCKECHKVFIEHYTYEAYRHKTDDWIVRLTKEGCSIRSIARLLRICCSTVQKRILHSCSILDKPIVPLNRTYEVDELCTYVNNKSNRIWIAYAYCRETKSVVDFAIGNRSKITLQPMIDKLLSPFASVIYTDKH